MMLALSLTLLTSFAPARAPRAPSRPPETERMDLVTASNGFGLLLPHQVLELDASGNPTQNPVCIRSTRELVENLTPRNPLLPVSPWPTAAVLPDASPGNHFVYLHFSQPIAIDSVLSSSPAGQAGSGRIGTIVVVGVDPTTAQVTPIQGRAFVGGKTYAGVDPHDPSQLELQTWVSARDDGTLVVQRIGGGTPGLGFPFTESSVPVQHPLLVSDNVFLFVPDTDGDLATHERFPQGLQVQVRASTGVHSSTGQALARTALAGSTVGPDTIPAEVIGPATVPGPGTVNVDPGTAIEITTTEAVQPLSIGTALVPPAGLGLGVQIEYGPPQQASPVPFTVLPLSVYDLTRWELTPAFPFPGQVPGSSCDQLNQVRLDFPAGVLLDLAANLGVNSGSSSFEVGAGPGTVNAPIAPDAIYVARGGPLPSLSVLDLNGFGQSTGDPSFDFTYQAFPKGWSNFPNNPNLIQYGPTLHPPLFPGWCTLDGGSAGVFTLTRDSTLSDRLLAPPLVASVGDTALGASLDLVFNDGPDAGGCQLGGGNVCAAGAKKLVEVALQPGGGVQPPQAGQAAVNSVPGAANPISFAPHPNPPPLVFPPPCLQPLIGGQEPTSIFSVTPATGGGLGLSNLLVPGDPFGDPASGVPPSGLLAGQQNTWFVGPDRASLPGLAACLEHQFRQQIGHFLYVVDRARRELVVLNSNRMQLLDRIALPDPTELAMGPDLDYLAVTNQGTGEVAFVDIDPTSPSFHQVVALVPVGRGPRGVAWDPGNEDVLVCNEADGTVAVISAATLAVRKVVGAGRLSHPFDVVIGQRQEGFGTGRAVYFAWILDRSGALWLYESGPNGPNGWGYDELVGQAPFVLAQPKRLALDVEDLSGAVWIAHQGPLDPAGVPTGEQGGAITRVEIESAVTGPLPLEPGSRPQFRAMSLAVSLSIGESVLTGVPVDLAFDDQVNLGALPNQASAFSAGAPLAVNGKAQAKADGGGGVLAAKRPRYLFAAVPRSVEGPGAIDVIDLDTLLRVDTDAYLPGVQSVPASGVVGLMDYWRQ